MKTAIASFRRVVRLSAVSIIYMSPARNRMIGGETRNFVSARYERSLSEGGKVENEFPERARPRGESLASILSKVAIETRARARYRIAEAEAERKRNAGAVDRMDDSFLRSSALIPRLILECPRILSSRHR